MIYHNGCVFRCIETDVVALFNSALNENLNQLSYSSVVSKDLNGILNHIKICKFGYEHGNFKLVIKKVSVFTRA